MQFAVHGDSLADRRPGRTGKRKRRQEAVFAKGVRKLIGAPGQRCPGSFTNSQFSILNFQSEPSENDSLRKTRGAQ
jgi:hypothetical protein